MPALNLPRLLTVKETASILGISVGTLNCWRFNKRYDLAYIKVGRSIRYAEESVKKFLEQNTEAA